MAKLTLLDALRARITGLYRKVVTNMAMKKKKKKGGKRGGKRK